jgi:hypothetical protein
MAFELVVEITPIKIASPPNLNFGGDAYYVLKPFLSIHFFYGTAMRS